MHCIYYFKENIYVAHRQKVVCFFFFLFLPSQSAHTRSTFADITAHSTWPKPLLCCPRDLLLNKAMADWLTGWENDKGGWVGVGALV